MDDLQLQARHREQDERNTMQRAAILGVEYLDTRDIEATTSLAQNVLPIDVMYKGRLVPLKVGDDENPYVFGITSSTPQSLVKNLTKSYNDRGFNVQLVLISNSGFWAFMRRFDPPKEVVYDDVKIAQEGDSTTLERVSNTLESVRSDDVLNYLIQQADTLNASDIHLECQRENVRIRFRVDGALHVVAVISKDKYRVLQASIASKSNISTAATDAQSGHMQQELTKDGKSHLLNMRIETIPTIYGQDIVIRLFNFDESLLKLELLGLPDWERKALDEVVSHPRGMVLVVGPTGSGKSTTLYSMITALNQPDRKIITLEDPVEYSISGVSQIPVDTTGGDSFAEKLRAVLRLDPDVVMVGEIRDADAARTAIQASITGHLVLSTFHASNAATAFSRMIDLIGINPIFSTAIRMVIAQRLVRKLDDATKEKYEPDDATKRWIREVLKDLPEHAERPNLDEIYLWRPVETPDSPFGFKGRIVLMEQMIISPEIQKFLRGDILDVNADVIEKAAKKEGMISLLQMGVLRALAGETTLEEINRVI
ncbi:MAG TPA: ATPase, T2SS/T4P/T4SS family [Verrucomicrobiae bacterium]|nr:ATPase, T2SS/T4P/T4SS family [Verrucomicrobiae bacterium]